MAHYKIVNNVRKKLTAKEEKQFKADEEQAIINNENFIKAEETKKAKKESGRQKLKDLGLDDDEIDALTN